jgi:periplasmic protein TonB
MNRLALMLVAAAGCIAQSWSSPVVLWKVTPQYTEAARKAKVEGKVVLTIQVGADGRVHHVRVSRALGSGLDEQAISAVRQWRFRPAMNGGTPVSVAATIEIPFRLGDTPEHTRV